MLISEVFGRGIDDLSADARASRSAKLCPFRGSTCTKSSKTNPIGICSLSDGKEAAAICPVRFLENDRIFTDAAKLAFGAKCEFAVFPEVRILKVPQARGKDRKIGKVDFLLGKISEGCVRDFAALEVQASYFSGESIRPAMDHFLRTDALNAEISNRRPDFRSSAQKRLMPQLQLKVPVFRRWSKKLFVVVDTQFFRSMPVIRKENSFANSEIVWLVYPINKNGDNYQLESPEAIGTQWDDVVTSLREGVAPEPAEIIEEMQSKLSSRGSVKPRMLSA